MFLTNVYSSKRGYYFWHCLSSCVFKTQGSSRNFTPDDRNRSCCEKPCLKKTNTMVNVQNCSHILKQLTQVPKLDSPAKLRAHFSKQHVIIFIWLVHGGVCCCYFCQFVFMLQICEHLWTEPEDLSGKRQWKITHASICTTVSIFAITLPVPKIIAFCRKVSCFLDELSPEDGASELLRNVGNYRLTRCHIPKD